MARRAAAGGTIQITAKVDAARTTQTFKRARRDIDRRKKTGLRRAGERATLPAARRAARREAGPAGEALEVKARSSHAFLTGRTLRQGRIIGLHNFGGVVRAPIKPRRGKRAVVVGGQPVAQVTTPRVYRAKHFLEHAVDQTLPAFEQVLLTEVMKAFNPLDHTP